MKNKQIIRKKFRDEVLTRDGYKCKVCGRNDVKLDPHHIENRENMPNQGYVKENGITLCDCVDGCHMKAEKYHITNGKDCDEGFHPTELFKLIGSNLELAKKESRKL